jgi:hypothetical protein
MLLHRLVDQEIDTMRAAEVRGDAVTFDEVVGFYGATRFLYPAKLGALESRFEAVRKTWEQLIAANNDVFKIFMLRRVVDGQMAVKNSICAFEYAPGTWQVQHLVSSERHELTGTLAALIGMTDWLDNRPGIKAIRLSYRPTNPGTNRLFHGLAEVLPNARSLEKVSNYFVAQCGDHHGGPPAAAEVEVRLAQSADTDDVRALYRREHPELPEWLGLHDLQLTTLDARYVKRGLNRSRAILVASRAGQICGSVICWWASEGVNFSFLENAIEDLVIDQTLPPALRAAIARDLLGAAENHYRSRGRRYLVALINDDMADLVAASAVLPPPEKQYAVLTLDAKEVAATRVHFESYYTQMLRESAAAADTSVGQKGQSR